MKLLIDMNLSPAWVGFFAGQGIEATHWSTVGQPTSPDSEILAFAAVHEWVVFTHDLDFGTLLASLKTSAPSVIQVRCQDVLPAAIGDIVIRALRMAEPHLQAGALVTVDSQRHRIRLLPL
jgi:predicted nuclease of predicted toxin-antitoxin system